MPTFHALKLLEQAGYIELTDERDNASRILFVMDKEELYHCPFLDKRQEALIALLLRTYTGVFTDYVYINEELLSQRLQMPMNELYQQLLLLSRMRVIHYIPRKQTPFIIYSQRRIDSKYIVIPSEIYEERKVRYAHRVDEICRYVYSSEVCRSRFLLAYFGEKRSTDCGQCDVCRKKNKYAMPPDDLIKIQIVELLKGSTCFVSQLLDQLPFERTMLLPVIRKMLEDDVLLIKNGSLSLVDE